MTHYLLTYIDLYLCVWKRKIIRSCPKQFRDAEIILTLNSNLIQLYKFWHFSCYFQSDRYDNSAVYTQCVYELSRCGVNLDATNNSGETALHAMIRRGKFECVLGLLAKGTSAAVKGSNGDSALHMAIEVICPSVRLSVCRKSADLIAGNLEVRGALKLFTVFTKKNYHHVCDCLIVSHELIILIAAKLILIRLKVIFIITKVYTVSLILTALAQWFEW